MNQIKISHPGGAYGNFLAYLLNYMITGQRNLVKQSVYDFVADHKSNIFWADHTINNCSIYINVNTASYLKYMINNINRTADANLILEDLKFNTFEKIQLHVILDSFKESLQTISRKSAGNVSEKYIREWLRLCFFANNGTTITQIINTKPKNCYYVDFEMFFSRDSIKQNAHNILRHFDFKIVTSDIDDIIDEFFSKQYYKNHINTTDLTDAFQKNQNVPLNLNIVEQAWLDNWLVEQYNIDPRLCDEYFKNTKELINFYNLPVDISR